MFRVTGLDAAEFSHLYGLDHVALAREGVVRTAPAQGGMPCRVSLADSAPGEPLLLLNYEHQPAPNPYRSRHAIFVREGVQGHVERIGELPKQLASRLLSLRAFDRQNMMIDGEVVEGREADVVIERFLALPDAAYIHAHFARRGCYAARIDRV